MTTSLYAAPAGAQPFTYLPTSGIAYRFRQMFDLVLVFTLIFNFPCLLPPLYRSVEITTLFVGALLLLNRSVTADILRVTFTNHVIRIGIMYALITAYAYLWTKIQVAEEYEQTRATFYQAVYSGIAICLYVYLRRRHGVEGTLKLLYWAFVAQSIIQLGGYISPDFLYWVRVINPEDFNNPGARVFFNNHRGFAMCSVKFFGLSVVYGVFMVGYIFLRNRKFNWRDIVLLIIFFCGACFTARSFFVGVAFSIMLIAMSGRAEILVKIAFGAGSAILAGSLLFSNSLKARLEGELFPWLFEAWYTFQSTGKFETRSSSILFEGHHFYLTTKQILFGDGMYFVPGTNYPYGDTDAGYWRLILFGGIFYVLLRVILFAFMLLPFFMMKQANSKIAFGMMMFCLIFYNIKGDIYSGLSILHPLLMLMGLIVAEMNHPAFNCNANSHIRLRPIPPPHGFIAPGFVRG